MPLTTYPTQALETLSSASTAATIPAAAGDAENEVPSSWLPPTTAEEEDGDQEEDELAALARAHSKFVALLRNQSRSRALNDNNSMNRKGKGKGGDQGSGGAVVTRPGQTVAFNWRGLHFQLASPSNTFGAGGGGIYGFGGLGYREGLQELKFPAPLSYFSAPPTTSDSASSPSSQPSLGPNGRPKSPARSDNYDSGAVSSSSKKTSRSFGIGRRKEKKSKDKDKNEPASSSTPNITLSSSLASVPPEPQSKSQPQTLSRSNGGHIKSYSTSTTTTSSSFAQSSAQSQPITSSSSSSSLSSSRNRLRKPISSLTTLPGPLGLGRKTPRPPLPPPKPTTSAAIAWHRNATSYRNRESQFLSMTMGNGGGSSRMSYAPTKPPLSNYHHGSVVGTRMMPSTTAGMGEFGMMGRRPFSSFDRPRTRTTSHMRMGSLPSNMGTGSSANGHGNVNANENGDGNNASENPNGIVPASMSSESGTSSASSPSASSTYLSAQSASPPNQPTSRADGGGISENENVGINTNANNANAYPTLPNPHTLPESATSRYFAPVYRVYVPTSVSLSSSPSTSVNTGAEPTPDAHTTAVASVMEECEAQLRTAGVWPYGIQVGDIVANLGYVPASPSQPPPPSQAFGQEEVNESSWMIFDGQRLVRFDPQNPPIPPSLQQQSQSGAPRVPVEDAIVAGIPCPTYYAHILPKGTNPVWPLSIPIYLLPFPHASRSDQEDLMKSTPSTRGTGSSTGVQFSLVQVMAQVPSHKGPVRVQRFSWTARCDFRRRTPVPLSTLRDSSELDTPRPDDIHPSASAEVDDPVERELGLWAGEWVLEAEGTPEGRAMLERILDESYRFGYGRLQARARAWKWEVVLEKCEGDVLWLRYVIVLLCFLSIELMWTRLRSQAILVKMPRLPSRFHRLGLLFESIGLDCIKQGLWPNDLEFL